MKKIKSTWDINITDASFVDNDLMQSMVDRIVFDIDVSTLKDAGTEVYQVTIANDIKTISQAKKWVKKVLKHDAWHCENEFAFIKEADAALFILRWQ